MKIENRALRPDAQAFDEIRITTVPRWKESELSGSEWRISASIQFLRKGVVRHEVGLRDVETAAGFVYAEMMRAHDAGKAYYAGEDDSCDQEGCKEVGTIKKFLIKNFCKDGHPTEPYSPSYRLFCDKHKRRGDCGLEDADSNYREVL